MIRMASNPEEVTEGYEDVDHCLRRFMEGLDLSNCTWVNFSDSFGDGAESIILRIVFIVGEILCIPNS